MRDGAETVELLVCIKCRGQSDPSEDEQRPGHQLHHRLSDTGLDGVRITPVECLSNCDRGCTIALRGAGRWTYVYGAVSANGDLSPILEGAARYRDSTDGLVPWRERPEHFRKNCIARIPPIPEAPNGKS